MVQNYNLSHQPSHLPVKGFKEKCSQSFADGATVPNSKVFMAINFRLFFIGFAYILLFIFLTLTLSLWAPFHSLHNNRLPSVLLERYSLDHLPEFIVKNSSLTTTTKKNCTYYTCFDVYKCSHTHSGRISVYLYPLVEFVDEEKVPVTQKISEEFYSILKAITKSDYFTSNPEEACLFIPTIDLLNQNRIHPKDVSKALAALPQ